MTEAEEWEAVCRRFNTVHQRLHDAGDKEGAWQLSLAMVWNRDIAKAKRLMNKAEKALNGAAA